MDIMVVEFKVGNIERDINVIGSKLGTSRKKTPRQGTSTTGTSRQETAK